MFVWIPRGQIALNCLNICGVLDIFEGWMDACTKTNSNLTTKSKSLRPFGFQAFRRKRFFTEKPFFAYLFV